MTNDVKGDSTSTSSRELMLWLQYEGGQLPIGWGDGPAGRIEKLFGTSWTLYENVNTDTGITVSSLLPDTQFSGSFSGDLKDWLLALVDLGKFSTSTYVNVGNAGTEFFYGNAVMNATLALQIDIGATVVDAVASSLATSVLATTSSATSTMSTSVERTTTSTVATVLSEPQSSLPVQPVAAAISTKLILTSYTKISPVESSTTSSITRPRFTSFSHPGNKHSGH